MSQSLELMLAAATALAHDPEVVFVINGGGAARPGLEVAARGLPNVQFVDMQPRGRLPEVLAAADIHVVPLKRGLGRSSVPSKTYSILAAGRPVLASVDRGTEVERVVERAGAGVSVPPDDAEAFTKALTRLVAAPDELAQHGRGGPPVRRGLGVSGGGGRAVRAAVRRASRPSSLSRSTPAGDFESAGRTASVRPLWAKPRRPRRSHARAAPAATARCRTSAA